MSDTSIVWIGDLHNGSDRSVSLDPQNEVQERLKERWELTQAALGRGPDILAVVGDSIDGPQEKGGDLITADPIEQSAGAVDLIMSWAPKEVILLTGTGYHVTRNRVEYERNVLKLLEAHGIKASLHRKLRLEVNEWFVVWARHHTGTSSIPYGKLTAPNKSKYANALKDLIAKRPIAHLNVYAHAHNYSYSEDRMGGVVVLPCWEAEGGKYGDERCDGWCDLGAFKTVISNKERRFWSWEKSLHTAEVADPTIKR